MEATFRKYLTSDHLLVRNFIVANYSKNRVPNSWLIDRWEFVPYVQETINGTLNQWEERIGLWEYENGQLAAVACTDGETYFILDTLEPDIQIINQIVTYAEEKLYVDQSGSKSVCIAIPDFLVEFQKFAASRGYVEDTTFCTDSWSEHIIYIDIDKEFQVNLPPGYRLTDGNSIDNDSKALGHIMAFDYPGTSQAESAMKHYGNMRNAPDYRPELDLFILNPQGEVTAFCNLWLDEVNKIAIFEPVGTHKDYRRLGLGRAVMYEGLNRLHKLGVTRAYVGAEQPFYRQIGFKRQVFIGKWRKSLS